MIARFRGRGRSFLRNSGAGVVTLSLCDGTRRSIIVMTHVDFCIIETRKIQNDVYVSHGIIPMYSIADD